MILFFFCIFLSHCWAAWFAGIAYLAGLLYLNNNENIYYNFHVISFIMAIYHKSHVPLFTNMFYV